MLLIGLTGSIATGKSTVSRILAAPPYNLPIIDADLLARQVVEPGTSGYRKIVEYFGPTTPDLLLDENAADTTSSPHGAPLNRAALGRRVFGASASKQTDRAVLNAIVHPAVRRAIFTAVLRHHLHGERAVVLDVPLLFEAGLDRFCGYVLVVGVRDPAVQMARLTRRDPSLSDAEAADRVRSQGDVHAKVARCRARGSRWGEVVWNDGDEEQLRDEVRRVVMHVEMVSPKWWSRVLWACPPLAVLWGMVCMGVVWLRSRRRVDDGMKR